MPTAEIHILLALATGPSHGYELMRRVERQTDGQLAPGPGTLYAALKRLSERGLIRETDRQSGATGRRRYAITVAGKSALNRELNRLAEVLRQAREAGWRSEEGGFA